MNQMIDASQSIATPHQELAATLEARRPRSILVLSLNPVPLLDEWCARTGCTLKWISEPDPFPRLREVGRFDLVIVADQLEYMDRHDGEELLGRLRNLHTEVMLVMYQPGVAPERLRWSLSHFFGMGLRKQGRFTSGDREMALYSYELASYNFVRSWNNSRFWANPENWGKYWW